MEPTPFVIILSYARDRNKGFTPTSLARDMKLTLQAAEEWIRALVEMGHLRATGRRRKHQAIVELSDSGRRYLEAA